MPRTSARRLSIFINTAAPAPNAEGEATTDGDDMAHGLGVHVTGMRDKRDGAMARGFHSAVAFSSGNATHSTRSASCQHDRRDSACLEARRTPDQLADKGGPRTGSFSLARRWHVQVDRYTHGSTREP